jgi:hypothetical protein
LDLHESIPFQLGTNTLDLFDAGREIYDSANSLAVQCILSKPDNFPGLGQVQKYCIAYIVDGKALGANIPLDDRCKLIKAMFL